MSEMSLSTWIDTMFNSNFQELESVIYDMFKQFNIDENSDAQLDKIGAAICCPRQGLSDENYRIKIKAFAAVQNSSGRPDEVITAVKIITASQNVTMKRIAPATIGIVVDGLLGTFLVQNLRTFIEGTLGAGIGLDYIVHEGDLNSFTFDDVDGTIDYGKGFGATDDEEVGGGLTFIII